MLAALDRFFKGLPQINVAETHMDFPRLDP